MFITQNRTKIEKTENPHFIHCVRYANKSKSFRRKKKKAKFFLFVAFSCSSGLSSSSSSLSSYTLHHRRWEAKPSNPFLQLFSPKRHTHQKTPKAKKTQNPKLNPSILFPKLNQSNPQWTKTQTPPSHIALNFSPKQKTQPTNYQKSVQPPLSPPFPPPPIETSPPKTLPKS
ncbi:LOW QUALITY PROTEIN: hypothetical protein TorRG33x02_332530 [Trema orientale]|uniref:Uncharacterized protein n=1 Tax=Trema orientale TaxID=63057 RepID=A0A2P5B5A4_TREOI|nr:LOW QUALITY PROTEIN: hypothetical protein TorRG33x02_332530 [Trema orientale]